MVYTQKIGQFKWLCVFKLIIIYMYMTVPTARMPTEYYCSSGSFEMRLKPNQNRKSLIFKPGFHATTLAVDVSKVDYFLLFKKMKKRRRMK